jgi:hypothetical protein
MFSPASETPTSDSFDISADFRLLVEIPRSGLVEDWPLGYRLMCRFHSYHIWRHTRSFRYIMRLDEDCILRSAGVNPIEWLSETGVDFASLLFLPETHKATNRTLEPFVRQYAREAFPGVRSQFYDHFFPYTNLYITRTAFWRRSPVQRFLRTAIRQPNFLKYRWGDIPVLGAALNMYADPGKRALLPSLSYKHESCYGLTLVGSAQAAIR